MDHRSVPPKPFLGSPGLCVQLSHQRASRTCKCGLLLACAWSRAAWLLWSCYSSSGYLVVLPELDRRNALNELRIALGTAPREKRPLPPRGALRGAAGAAALKSDAGESRDSSVATTSTAAAAFAFSASVDAASSSAASSLFSRCTFVRSVMSADERMAASETSIACGMAF